MMRVVAGAYGRAPLLAREAEPAWRLLARHSVRDADRLRLSYRVSETDDSAPYAGADDMFAALDGGAIVISRANSIHPVWSVSENVAFRLCHDVLGHYAAHIAGRVADFSWEGECNAALAHERTLPIGTLRDALFTEIVGQAAWSLTYGSFADQKVAFL
jgi:hypothetical protein